jgi:hypothetical protein
VVWVGPLAHGEWDGLGRNSGLGAPEAGLELDRLVGYHGVVRNVPARALAKRGRAA